MGLTGIIYASIVVAWAAYLVPLALRRHDEAARARSVDRFSSTMRVLSRHGSGSSGRLVVSPPRPVDRVLNPGLLHTGSTAVVSAGRPSREALRAAACRRRRVLIGLVCGTAIVAAVAVLGLVPLWSVGIPVAMVGAFLVVARRQTRRASDSYWVEAKVVSSASSNVIRRGSSRVEASHGAAKSADDEPTVPLEAEELKSAVAGLRQDHAVAVALPTADGGSLWDPLPIMLPTYVDKAVAPRTIRTVDLGEAKTQSSEVWAASTRPPAGAATRTALGVEPDDELDAEPARVVNG